MTLDRQSRAEPSPAVEDTRAGLASIGAGVPLTTAFTSEHILAMQRTAGNQAVRRMLARWPLTTAGADLGPIISEAVHTTLTQALAGTADDDFAEALGNAVANALPAEVTQEQRTAAAARARALGATTAGAPPNRHTIPSALRALRRAADPRANTGTPPALGPEYFQRGLERDVVTGIGHEIAEPGDAVPRIVATNNVGFDLQNAIDAATNPRRLNELELEATVTAMLEERAAAESARDQPERAAHGARLGEMARRVLLLNHAITAAQSPPPEQTALETQILANASRLAEMHRTAQTEDATVAALGDDPALLAQQRVTLQQPFFGERFRVPAPSVDVRPEEALPATTDHAERQLAAGLRDQIRNQRAETTRLRNQVIPSPPQYTLPEFGNVYRSWSGFHNPGEEENDPQMRMLLQLVEGPNSAYTMAGMDGMESMSAASGGIARAMLMNFVAGQLEGQLHHGDSRAFANVIDAQQLRRNDSAVTGTASDPRYSTAGGYGPDRATGGTAAERASRARQAAAGQQASAEAARQVAAAPPEQQAAVAAQTGLAPRGGPAVPVLGARAPQAEEGWTYLVDVNASTEANPEPHLIARQQRTMSSEVAAYLMAARQQQQTLADPHRPAVEGETGGGPTQIGGAGMRTGGIEGATGDAAAIQSATAQREEPPELAGLAAARQASQRQVGAPQRGQASAAPAAAQLVTDLEAYLNDFFAQHAEPEWRLAAVLMIADREHGLGANLGALFDPGQLRQMLSEVLKVAGITAALNAAGPLGQLAGRAYHAHLAAQGIGNIQASIGLAAFLRNATGAGTFMGGRAWARMTVAVSGDIAQLLQFAVTAPLSHALEHHINRPPATPRSLGEACRPMMQDPVAREALLRGVDARMAELRGQGAEANRSDPEYAALEAFRRQLEPVSRPPGPQDAAADGALPGARAETDAMRALAGGHLRTAAQRQALHDAIPEDLRADVLLVENSTLRENTTRVVYHDGDVRIEVGPRAEAENVRQHVETARHLLRYKGIVGAIRRLLEVARQALGGGPAHGTRGAEARLEVDKLQRIIASLEEMQRTIDARADAVSRDPSRPADMDRELASLREQLAENQRLVNSVEPGRGWVAALAASADHPGLEILERAMPAANRDMLQAIDDVRAEGAGRMRGFDDWARQAATRMERHGATQAEAAPGSVAPAELARLQRERQTEARNLTSEIVTIRSMLNELQPGEVVVFTPGAAELRPGTTEAASSFDIHVRRADAAPGDAPLRRAEVKTVVLERNSSVLDDGVQATGDKLLDLIPPAGSGRPMPSGTREAAVVGANLRRMTHDDIRARETAEPAVAERVIAALGPDEVPIYVVGGLGAGIRRVILLDGTQFKVMNNGRRIPEGTVGSSMAGRLNAGRGHNIEWLHRVFIRTSAGEVITSLTNRGADAGRSEWVEDPRS